MQKEGIICIVRDDSLWKGCIVKLEKSEKTFIASSPIIFSKRTDCLEEDWENVLKEFDKEFTKVPGHEHDNYYFCDERRAFFILNDVIEEKERKAYADAWLADWHISHEKLRELNEEYKNAFCTLEEQDPKAAGVINVKFEKYKKKSAGLDWQSYYLKKLEGLIHKTNVLNSLVLSGKNLEKSDIEKLRNMKNVPPEDSEYNRSNERKFLDNLERVSHMSASYAFVLAEKYKVYKERTFSPTNYQSKRDVLRGWRLNKLNNSIWEDIRKMSEVERDLKIAKEYAPGGKKALEAQKSFEELAKKTQI